MTTIQVLKKISDFVKTEVCSKIELKIVDDDNANEYELKHPEVFTMFMPLKNELPQGLKVPIPCIIISFEEATDNTTEASFKIRLSFVTSSNGFYAPNEEGMVLLKPDYEGWQDLLNFMDLTRAELLKHHVLNGVAIDSGTKWRPYTPKEMIPDMAPFYFGEIIFNVSTEPYPSSEISKLL